VQIELIATGCPVLPGVTVGVQRGTGVVDQHPADGAEIRWSLEARLDRGHLRGPYVHGRPGARFLYLSWADGGGVMFRRAKLMLDEVPADVLVGADGSHLVGRLSLSMPDGSPLCAAVRPPVIQWSAGTEPG
jgi:hypothetical protein